METTLKSFEKVPEADEAQVVVCTTEAMETRWHDQNKPWDWEAILENPPPIMHLLDQYPDIFWDNWNDVEQVSLEATRPQVSLSIGFEQDVVLEYCQVPGHSCVAYKDEMNILYDVDFQVLGRLDGDNKIIYFTYKLKHTHTHTHTHAQEIVVLEYFQVPGHFLVVYKDEKNILYDVDFQVIGRLDGDNKIIYFTYKLDTQPPTLAGYLGSNGAIHQNWRDV